VRRLSFDNTVLSPGLGQVSLPAQRPLASLSLAPGPGVIEVPTGVPTSADGMGGRSFVHVQPPSNVFQFATANLKSAFNITDTDDPVLGNSIDETDEWCEWFAGKVQALQLDSLSRAHGVRIAFESKKLKVRRLLQWCLE
jgi:hypothetical protein